MSDRVTTIVCLPLLVTAVALACVCVAVGMILDSSIYTEEI